jgi:tripartite ATP-independent transporter DctP family solute receptor
MKHIKGNIGKFLVFLMIMASFISYGATKKPSVTITLATGMAENHAANIAFKKFIKTIEEKSGGKMTGILYPNNQLGGDVVAMQGVQDGSIAMAWTTTANQVTLVPELAIFDIPFLYDDLNHAVNVFENKEFLDKIQEKFHAVGLHSVGLTPTGFRWLSANKEIRKLEDLKGLKIRTMENVYHITAWKALGVTPTPLANSERYAALQQGTVDGQENVMENAYSTKMYEVQNVFINTQHICFVSSWTINKDFYDSLSPEHKKIFDEAMAACVKEAQEASITNEGELLKSLEGMGKKVIRALNDGEYDRWKKIAQPAAEGLVRKNVGDEMVDALHKAIGK